MARKIVFRLDDICPQMNHARFDRMRKIFDEYGVKPIIGVVPECKDPLLNCDAEDPHFWENMQKLQADGWTIAMHGCFHQYTTRENGLISHGFNSEFAGLPYDEQFKLLEYGKNKLIEHGIHTDVFMAPSHSYDKNTLRALKELGFRCLTDGLTARPYEYMGLLFVPCIEPKISNVHRFSTVCYHLNEAKNARFKETEMFLSQYRQQVITFEEARKIHPMPCWLAKIEEALRYSHKYYLKANVKKMFLRIRGNSENNNA